MYILGRLIETTAWFVDKIFVVVYFALIIRIVISWVGADPYNQIVQVIYSVTEPILAPFRRLPLQLGAIDFSPIVAFFVLNLVSQIIVGLLYGLARGLMN